MDVRLDWKQCFRTQLLTRDRWLSCKSFFVHQLPHPRLPFVWTPSNLDRLSYVLSSTARFLWLTIHAHSQSANPVSLICIAFPSMITVYAVQFTQLDVETAPISIGGECVLVRWGIADGVYRSLLYSPEQQEPIWTSDHPPFFNDSGASDSAVFYSGDAVTGSLKEITVGKDNISVVERDIYTPSTRIAWTGALLIGTNRLLAFAETCTMLIDLENHTALWRSAQVVNPLIENNCLFTERLVILSLARGYLCVLDRDTGATLSVSTKGFSDGARLTWIQEGESFMQWSNGKRLAPWSLNSVTGMLTAEPRRRRQPFTGDVSLSLSSAADIIAMRHGHHVTLLHDWTPVLDKPQRMPRNCPWSPYESSLTVLWDRDMRFILAISANVLQILTPSCNPLPQPLVDLSSSRLGFDETMSLWCCEIGTK